MKKLLSLALLCLLALAPAAFAGHQDFKPIAAVTLNNTTTATSGAIYSGDSNRLSFLVDDTETDAGAQVSVAVTVLYSFDGTNYLAGSFYDYAGGATFTASKTISATGRYIFWLDRQTIAPWTKVTVTATGSDATHTALITVYALGGQ